jgi:hypothetical protein
MRFANISQPETKLTRIIVGGAMQFASVLHLVEHLTLTRATLFKSVMSIATQLPIVEFGYPSFHCTACPTLEFADNEHQEYPAEQDLSSRPEVQNIFGRSASTKGKHRMYQSCFSR